MQFLKPSKMGIFQLVVASLLVALLSLPGEAIHGGPMVKIKLGHGHGGGMNAATILAAGIVVKLIKELHKKHHKGGFSGFNLGGGHKMSSDYEMVGGHGGGYGMGGGHGGGYGMGYSFESHDAHLSNYGYEPQGYAWAK